MKSRLLKTTCLFTLPIVLASCGWDYVPYDKREKSERRPNRSAHHNYSGYKKRGFSEEKARRWAYEDQFWMNNQ